MACFTSLRVIDFDMLNDISYICLSCIVSLGFVMGGDNLQDLGRLFQAGITSYTGMA